jgi:hypothetical protein
LGFVVFVQTEERTADAVVLEQNGRVACVLGGYDICFAQDAKGPQGDVLEVPDGSGDEGEQAPRIPRSNGWPA